jgi:mono/diheme cytochrome c family protein
VKRPTQASPRALARRRESSTARGSVLAVLAISLAVVAAGCGSEGVQVNDRGAQLFSERCAGCHTLKAAGTQGSIPGEPPTGPNLNKRKLTKDEALYAIRNGGFSGAIMPQNIVVGKDAEAVAEFLAKYAGTEAKSPPSPQDGGASTQSSGGSASSR